MNDVKQYGTDEAITFYYEPTMSVAEASLVNDYVSEVPGPALFFNRLNTKKKGEGGGSKVLKALLDYADKRKLPIINQVNSYGGMDHNQLVSFYKRNGFEFIDQKLYGDTGMVRYPNSKIIEDIGDKHGAGLILINGKEILLCKRAPGVNEPRTWSYPGGRMDEGEEPKATAIRELREETKYKGNFMIVQHFETYREKDFQYDTFVGFVKEKFTPKLDWENTASGWFKLDDLPQPLHTGMKRVLPKLTQFMNEKHESKGSVTSKLLRLLVGNK